MSYEVTHKKDCPKRLPEARPAIDITPSISGGATA